MTEQFLAGKQKLKHFKFVLSVPASLMLPEFSQNMSIVALQCVNQVRLNPKKQEAPYSPTKTWNFCIVSKLVPLPPRFFTDSPARYCLRVARVCMLDMKLHLLRGTPHGTVAECASVPLKVCHS